MKDAIRTYIFDFETESEYGFNPAELKKVIADHNLTEEQFYEALGVNTCMSNEKGETIIYAVDVEQALRVLLEGKQTPFWIWD